METSPRCIEYPVENDREEAEAPALNTVALIPTNNSDREPVEFASYDTAFEALCTQPPITIKIEELHFEYQ